MLKLLLKNVEEILFGRIFLGAHTTQTVSKHVWVCRCDICKVFCNIKLVFFCHRRHSYIAYQEFMQWVFEVLGKNNFFYDIAISTNKNR